MSSDVGPSEMKPDTAYMEVPRCDACAHWINQRCRRMHASPLASLVTSPCAVVEVWTEPSFGCVQFEPKVKS